MKKSTIVLALMLCVPAAAHAQRPMCIVNGVRIDNSGAAPGKPMLLSPETRNAIESVEVLKGVAAAKMYGPDAVNGVISITTKKDAGVAYNWAGACGSPPVPEGDPLAKVLYTPELVMAHQEAIKLTDRQRMAILDAVKDGQSKSMDAQFKLASAGEKLTRSLAATTVDEASVLQQIDQVLGFEREVKRAQITLLVRIKNQLTAEQQGMLDKLR